jgi:predicted GIY-YIG superfamily endonuclease
VTTLYRLYDKAGALLYVGIAEHWPTRMKQHAREKAWWEDVANVATQVFAERERAADAERNAIQTERPKHNIVHARRERQRTPQQPRPKRVHWLCHACGEPIADEGGAGLIQVLYADMRAWGTVLRQEYGFAGKSLGYRGHDYSPCDPWDLGPNGGGNHGVQKAATTTSADPSWWRKPGGGLEIDYDAEDAWSVMWADDRRLPKWKASHYGDCDPGGDSEFYWFDLSRIRTLPQLTSWNKHLMAKQWIVHTNWADVVEYCSPWLYTLTRKP